MAKDDKPTGPAPALNSTRLVNAQHDYRTYFATIPHGVDPETIMQPTYWRHHVGALRPKDVIRCFAEDGTWERWVTVIMPENGGALVSTLFDAKHETIGEVSTDDYVVEWKGPALQFCVVRKSTGDRIREKLYPKSQAESALMQLKQRAA